MTDSRNLIVYTMFQLHSVINYTIIMNLINKVVLKNRWWLIVHRKEVGLTKSIGKRWHMEKKLNHVFDRILKNVVRWRRFWAFFVISTPLPFRLFVERFRWNIFSFLYNNIHNNNFKKTVNRSIYIYARFVICTTSGVSIVNVGTRYNMFCEGLV